MTKGEIQYEEDGEGTNYQNGEDELGGVPMMVWTNCKVWKPPE
jgi:hypothetical protein